MELDKYLAELVGTFALVFIGAGAVTANAITNGAVGIVGIALAHGLVLMTMIYAVGHISGTHINPAVTISMIVTKNIKPMTGVMYIIFQLVGATLAGLLLGGIFTAAPAAVHLGTPALASGFSETSGLLLETVLTFFLAFAIFGAAVDKRAAPGFAGVAIGLVLTFDILMGGAFTGAAMNPARAIGPAVASGFWTSQWIYWVGPIIGAVVAGLYYSIVLVKKQQPQAKQLA